MSEEEILCRLENILVEGLGVPEKNITKEARFEEDLKIDSFDRFDLGYHTEEEFGIVIKDEEIMEIKTLNGYIKYIYQKVNEDK